MPSSRRDTSRRRIRPATLVGGLLLLLVALALLAIPFLKAPSHAEAARSDLEGARAALAAGDLPAAEAHVQSARRHADEVQGAVQGFGGDVWHLFPVAGGPVRDVRHLGNALDELTSVSETALATWPQVNGDEAQLLGDGRVDLGALERLTATGDELAQRLTTAEKELESVADQRLAGGQRFAQARDSALEQVAPLNDALDKLSPVLHALPGLLGAKEERKFLIAMLNPSELRYSGGAVLALSELTTEDGRFELSETFDAAESPAFFRPHYWLKVKGNPFHRGRQSAQTATYAPTWPVSGNELANAFRSLRGRPGGGVIAVDSVALGRLLEFTGPISVPGYPTLTADNFVRETVGNYDAHPDPTQRRALNKSLAPAFTDALLAPEDVVAKMTTLHELAQARHFAVYFRTSEAQDAFSGLGLTGDFPDTDNDYLGVFTQNTNISKSDYWQRRRVDSNVRLREDGSARVRLRITVHNDAPPAPPGYVDPRRTSYTTRWNESSVAAFLPTGAVVTKARLDGRDVPFTRRQYFGRPYVRRTIEFPPQAKKTYELTYRVPAAAVQDGDDLVYRLALTPQGMVNPQAVRVRVRWPEGYDVMDIPDGWRRTGPGVATYATSALTDQPAFSIAGSKKARQDP